MRPTPHEVSLPRAQLSAPTVLNAYAVHAPLVWQVNVYRVQPLSPRPAGETADLKHLLYSYGRRVARPRVKGPFWTLDAEHVAAPSSCVLPASEDYRGYRITPLPAQTVNASDAQHLQLVREMLKTATREALRATPEFTDLIQEGTRFTERPTERNRSGDLHHCRRYEVRPMTLRGDGDALRWALQLIVDTVSVDAHTIGEYYRAGRVQQAADFIEIKRRNRTTRQGDPVAVRVLYLPDAGGYGQFAPLCNPELVLSHAGLSPQEQQAHAQAPFTCTLYLDGQDQDMPLPADSLHLILDTQISGESHEETILGVPERLRFYRRLHDVLNGLPIYGQTLRLEGDLTPVAGFAVRPPALALRGRTLPAPVTVTPQALHARYRDRAAHVRSSGYLHSSADIDPLLAVPRSYGQVRGEQFRQQLQAILAAQDHTVKIAGPVLYGEVEDIAAQLGEHDALIAVLPEGSRRARHSNDTHEQIKRLVPVTSQCVQKDRTTQPERDNPKQARNAEFNAQAVISNLLVKHGWLPFLPAETAAYNVRFGIDVGGVQNDKVMVCVGYGLSEPLPIFRAEEIRVGREQAEPILDGPLYLGMMELLARMRAWVAATSRVPDFNRLLIFRDGDSNGEADVWQERDAFERLHREFLEQGWIDENASWVLVEISKGAAGWRQFQQDGTRTANPVTGTYSFPFGDPFHALVSTTGRPTLSQGTAQPLLVKMSAVAGTFDPHEVVQDLVWEADLGFTKLDQGYALPFTLHVADSGALQLARTYSIAGFTL